jgi:Family of unknown function (DUF6159)
MKSSQKIIYQTNRGATMFEKFARSWELVKASGDVLVTDKQLLVFPLVSSIAAGIVCLAFILPMLGLGGLDGLTGMIDGFDDDGRKVSAGTYLLGFLFYLTQYFVIFYFNAALICAVMIRLDGGSPTVSDGFKIANSKFVVIFCYAMIAATVGMILRVIQERVGFIGSIIVGLIGVAWTLATSMVVPVLVTQHVGPIEAVQESAALVKKTWGENIIGNAGIGIAFGFIGLFMAVISAGLLLVAFVTKSIFIIVATILLVVVAFTVLSLVQAALAGIYSAALYRYGETGESALGFDNSLLGTAFTPKD